MAVPGWPTLTVEIMFNDGALSTTGTWTDVSAYVRRISTKRGRQRELDRFTAGTAVVVLDNRDRRFDPNHATGPHFGDLRSGRRIRIRATWAAVTYDLWTGHVDDWPQSYDVNVPKDATVELSCTDSFKQLAMYVLPQSAYEMEMRKDAPSNWWSFDEPDGAAVAIDVAGNDDAGIQGVPDLAVPGLVSGSDGTAFRIPHNPQTRALAPRSDIISTYPFTITALVQTDRQRDFFKMILWASDSLPPVDQIFFGIHGGTSTDDDGKAILDVLNSGVARVIFSFTKVDDGSAHHLTAKALSSSSMKVYVDGIEETDVGSAGSPAFPTLLTGISLGNTPASVFGDFGLEGVLDEPAIWNGVGLADARILAHAEAALTGWAGDGTGERVGRLLDGINFPASLRSLDVGNTILGPALLDRQNLLDHLQALADTEYAGFYMLRNGQLRWRQRHALLTAAIHTTSQATFGDSGAELRYSDIQLDDGEPELANEIRVQRVGGTEVVAVDAASQTEHGRRVLSLPRVVYDNDNESRDAATWHLSHRKDPHLHVRRLQINPRYDAAALFPAVLARELEHRITVKRRPQNVGAVISAEVWIQAINHEIVANPRSWTTEFELAPAETESFWVLGDATKGVLGSTTRLAF